MHTNRRSLLLCGLGVALAFAALSRSSRAQEAQPEDPWPDLHKTFFNDRPIVEDPGIVTLEAPERAEDAALVPMTLSVHMPNGDPRRVAKLSLIIDQNPVPLAVAFALGEKAGVTSISTRMRVNSYTNVHLVAELSDGSLHSATRHVKAAGGCSAPMVKSPDEALATMGQTKFRLLPDASEGHREAQVMLRHPNNSGMQMDQITHLYTPARYIDHLAVYQGADLIFSMEAGISISEDPNLRFDYVPNGAKTVRLEAIDSTGAHFTAAWPAERNGA
jgi:sulfur-oxidizing protein SoxY